MANVSSAVATGLRTVKVTFSVALSDFGTGATGALNPANYTFQAQNVPPYPAAAVAAESVVEISTTVVEVTVDDDLSPEENYQVTVKSASDGGVTGVANAPSNASVFGAVPLIAPAERDFSILGMVPRMNLREDSTQDLEKFLNVLNDVLGLQLDRVDIWTDIFDFDLAPDNFLDLQLQDLGYPFQIALSTIDKRRLLSVLMTLYKEKGTIAGVKDATRFFLGYESDVLFVQASLAGGWILGSAENELGVDTILGSTFYVSTLNGLDLVFFNEAQAYDFAVKIGTPSAVSLTADETTKATALIEYLKPAHIHLRLVAATLPPPQNVTAASGTGQITIAWDAVTGADSYTVFYSKSPDVSAMSPLGYITGPSPYVDTVPTGEQRYYRVTARASNINGVASARVTATAG